MMLTTEMKQAMVGLCYRDVRQEPVMGDDGKPKKDRDGNPVLRHVPHTRPMAEADVLDAKIIGTTCVLVSRDGTKHRVAVKAAPKAEK
jgi:hypothetical protein